MDKPNRRQNGNKTRNTQGKDSKARQHRKLLAQETIEILEHGYLQGQPFGYLIEASVEGTRSYPENAPIPPPLKVDQRDTPTKFSVVNTTTLEAAWRLAQDYPEEEVAVLNFASAKNPGGGFLGGAIAQEESLALHSGLYACLKNDKMYGHHRGMKGGIYTDWCIFSPDVPVFRRESDLPNGGLLDEPWLMSVITSPCLNRSAMTRYKEITEKEFKAAIHKRMMRFLSVLAAHHSGNLVLGAWGCGVFGNDPNMIAQLFADLLLRHPRFQNRWTNVVFSVLDHTRGETTIEPFRRVFGIVDSRQPFAEMPLEEEEDDEEEWAHPLRRNNNSRRKKQKRLERRVRRAPDTPEQIAAKRAERKAKRERLALEQQEGGVQG